MRTKTPESNDVTYGDCIIFKIEVSLGTDLDVQLKIDKREWKCPINQVDLCLWKETEA